MAIGLKPNTVVFRGKLEFDNKGYFKKYDGNAAIDVIKYLESNEERSNNNSS